MFECAPLSPILYEYDFHLNFKHSYVCTASMRRSLPKRTHFFDEFYLYSQFLLFQFIKNVFSLIVGEPKGISCLKHFSRYYFLSGGSQRRALSSYQDKKKQFIYPDINRIHNRSVYRGKLTYRILTFTVTKCYYCFIVYLNAEIYKF